MISDIDRRARFEQLSSEVFEPLQRYLRRRAPHEQAEEVFSDTMLTLWRRLDEVPRTDPLPWCYGVAKRTLANSRRGRQRHLRLVSKLQSTRPDSPPSDPADLLADDEVAAALGRLPEADQEILRLWAWESLEPREIAMVLGTTANSVSLRLGRAKKRLASEMERQNPQSAGQREHRDAEVRTDE